MDEEAKNGQRTYESFLSINNDHSCKKLCVDLGLTRSARLVYSNIFWLHIMQQ